MTLPTLTRTYKKAMYSQLSGVPVKLALCSSKYEMLHEPVMCKDYIQDAFWSEHTKENADVYGFKWAPGRMSPTENTYRLALQVDPPLRKVVPVVEAWVNQWEKQLKFPESKIIKTTDEALFLLVFDKAWTKQPIRISLLTTLIRTGFVKDKYKGDDALEFLKMIGSGKIAPITSNDAYNVLRATKTLKTIWEERKFPEQTYKQFEGSYSIHNDSGIVAYSN